MKKLITLLSLFAFVNAANAAETVSEKADAKINDTKRSVKHAVNKADEKACDNEDKDCDAEKKKHRSQETKQYIKDKYKEGKNILDNKND